MTKLVPPSRFLPTQKRVRVVRDGRVIVDTTNALLVWEHEYFPRYYFLADEIGEPCHDTSGIGDLRGTSRSTGTRWMAGSRRTCR